MGIVKFSIELKIEKKIPINYLIVDLSEIYNYKND